MARQLRFPLKLKSLFPFLYSVVLAILDLTLKSLIKLMKEAPVYAAAVAVVARKPKFTSVATAELIWQL